jgi:hypothetical protein
MKRLFVLLLPFVLAAQPVYNASTPSAIAKGVVFTLFNAETPTPGNGTTAASQQVSFASTIAKTGNPFSIDGKFSGLPGATNTTGFEVDVQVAAVDVDANYQTINNGNITTVDATNFTFHIDCPQVVGRFMRLLVRTRTNSVTLTATVTGG